MGKFLSFRDGNKTSEHGLLRFLSKITVGDVITGFTLTQNSPTGMSVLLSSGDCVINDTPYKYEGWSDATETLAITTADPTNPRLDLVVIYVDKALSDQTNNNSPDGLKIAVVAGTPNATPTVPSSGTITTQIGASNPYIIVGRIRVNNGATSIVNSNITDLRSMVSLSTENNPSSKALKDQVLSGGIITQSSGLIGAITNITYSVGGRQYILNGIDNYTYPASKDVYVDMPAGGSVPVYTAVNNNATAPALASNSVRVGIVITGASAISNIRQVGFDSLNNMIYRTRRVIMDGRGDGGGGTNAIDYNHTGTLIQYPVSSSSFGRFFTVIPEDYESGSPALVRVRHNAVTGTTSTVWNYYLSCQAIGQNQTTEGWNIASNVPTSFNISSSEIIADFVIDVPATKLSRSNIFGSALKPTGNTQSVVVQFMALEYRPVIL